MVAEAQVASTAVVMDIAVGGMTCAACGLRPAALRPCGPAARVRRVERGLGTLDAVTGEVNLATGRARVGSPSSARQPGVRPRPAVPTRSRARAPS
ncbi:heavy metal-associated domain-containing protein [Streptomyces sp. NPDC088180]|uniref:heavy-metal-associated domain-containing protein n=1 Tax=Streptomyces sp. NPDC088180 TaxID=3365837 RepID=UPI00380E45A8